MAMAQAGLMKVEFVMEIARKDPRFLNDLARDPYRTLEQSGIDLSRGEVIAILDIVKDTNLSTLAPHLNKLRNRWGLILEEESQRFEKESKAGKEGNKPSSTKKDSSKDKSKS